MEQIRILYHKGLHTMKQKQLRRAVGYVILLLINTTLSTLGHVQQSPNKQPVLLIIGTRPEGIKMAPIYYALKNQGIPTIVCSTGQHADLLTDVLELFEIQPDYNLTVMKPNQNLFYLTTTLLNKLKEVFEETKPALVLVQGDTTSAMAGALAAFYLKIPVGHVEAGLRTGNIYMPFPEEVNRKIISTIATFNFAPTQLAADHLLKEGVLASSIYLTGNTVVDALLSVKNRIDNGSLNISDDLQGIITQAEQTHSKIMLLTAHRRESFDGGLEHIFNAIKKTLLQIKDLFIIYPVHPNPAIHTIIEKTELEQMGNIKIIKPLAYSDMIYLMTKCIGIATDSGGVQEEGVSLGKSVLVLRNETERPEGIETGLAELVGTDEEKVERTIKNLLISTHNDNSQHNVYGDGHAAEKIVSIIKKAIGY